MSNIHERAASINKNAEGEGWFLSETHYEGAQYQLQRDDEACIFHSDLSVWRNLIIRAANKDSNAVAAFNFLVRFCPKEWEAIRDLLKKDANSLYEQALDKFCRSQFVE